MKFFIFNFLLIFSQTVSSYYTENSTHKKFFLNEILTSDNLPTKIACDSEDECQSYILNSACIEKVCQCRDNNILSSDASKCLPHAEKYGSPCEDNIQCSHFLSAGGVCYDGRCVCKTGFHYLKGTCWKSVKLHEKCYKNEQCFSAYEYVGFECKNNACECRQNYYERLSSGCRRKRKAGESCNIELDCTDKSTCERMTCSSTTTVTQAVESITNVTDDRLDANENCPEGMFKLDNECVRELGMKCTADSECNHIKNAICLDNYICACQPVLNVASEDNRQCLRVTRGKVEEIERSSCKEDPECGVFGGNSFCQNRRCACKNGTYFEKDSTFCWTIKSLNEVCEDVRDCNPSATHTDCVETKAGKVCLCQKGYHPNGLECFPDGLEVGDSCKSNEDCLFPNSYCNSSDICACKDRHYLENKKCVPGVGTSCDKESDCAHLKNTECRAQNTTAKECLCLKNHTESENYKYCLPVINYKELCTESFQCKFPRGDQGVCKNNVCECLEGEHYSNEKCYKSKFIGDSCSSLSECFAGDDSNSVICLKGFCSCNYDYELDDSKICVKANSATKTNVYLMPLTFLLFVFTLGKF